VRNRHTGRAPCGESAG